MTIPLSSALRALSLSLALAVAGCSKPTSGAATSTQLAAPMTGGTAPTASSSQAGPAPAAMANGYSCNFPGPRGRSILARFTLDGSGAHDDQGLPFTILANSPTALVLAHARDDLANAPAGDVGAYVVAIDRRSLAMVQTTVGLNGPGSTRRGRCIAG